ncbi:hypothetical protein [Bacillus niameyensis]|uniref:hypothetical protein n=1 Tax=Bacillus niameyensis TaxID=1522308 RepID=UPI00078381CD|nr:hypothetical protein [Bacillus niameyensis]
MPDLLRLYRTSILRNFEIKNILSDVLPTHIEDYMKKLRASEVVGNSWDKIAALLNQYMEEFPDIDANIDNDLFEKLIFDVQDHIYIFPIESEIDAEELISRFDGEPQLNRHLNAVVEPKEKLISIRIEGNKILLLYRQETIKLGASEEETNFYVPCVIDFDNSLLQIRMRRHYLSKSTTNLTSVLSQVKNFINSLDGDIVVNDYNESTVLSLLYNIFKEESERAENVIKEHMKDKLTEEVVNQKISLFLQDELKMSEPELYADRVKSAFYQDLSLHLDPTEFYNGFIFAFTFLDKNFIKSSTRNPKKDPIYNSKVYWNLKDLIHEYKEVSELACYWKFDEGNFKIPAGKDFEFVEIFLREKYGSIEIHYYNSPSEKRRLKEDYVHSRISKYLFQDTLSE